MSSPPLIGIIGATGYVGGRLTPVLLAEGARLRVLTTNRAHLADRAWAEQVEVVEGDLTSGRGLTEFVEGCACVVYLAHFSGDPEAERKAARNFVSHASPKVRVVYLGGTAPDGDEEAEHLEQKRMAGAILRHALPTAELRAGMIIGAGSASHSAIRSLVQRLPVVIGPAALQREFRPIAIDDVIAYLRASIGHDWTGTMEIGTDAMTGVKLMELYASEMKLKRRIVSTRLLPTRLAAWLGGIFSDVPSRNIAPILRSFGAVRARPVDRAGSVFPEIKPMSVVDAFRRAEREALDEAIETRYTDDDHFGLESYEVHEQSGMLWDRSERLSTAPPEVLWRSAVRLGGPDGYGRASLLWRVRGWLDVLVGGPGVRRSRRPGKDLRVGDALDFWRVVAVVQGQKMVLAAEMKLPGRGWLAAEVAPAGTGSRLVIQAAFRPRGLLGWLYWWSIFPLHQWVFRSLVTAIVDRAETIAAKQAGLTSVAE